MEQMSLRTQSSLDVTDDALRQISAAVTKLVAEYVGMIGERPVRAENYAGKTTESIDTELSADGVPLEQLLAECRTIMALSRHNGPPRFFGYIASPSTPIGAYGDLIASALNANITCWRSGPAGTEVERLVVRWLGSLIGYDAQANGLLTSGGSMANLIALLIASRRRANVSRQGFWNAGPPMTVYASEEVHMSIAKAADILGIGRDQVRVIACDERQRMRVDVLRQTIEAELRDGLRPFCVVGSAGTTNPGAVDPLAEIARVANEFELWFHVDGAYGAPGVLDQQKQHLFEGLERADSVSLDPHKWLYVPVDARCLLFRDAAAAKAAFSTEEAPVSLAIWSVTMSPAALRVVESTSMDKSKALEAALTQIERAFGKGSIMKLGKNDRTMDIETVSTGSLGLDIALGVGGLPRGRVVEIYGPESSGKTTLALHCLAEAQKAGGICAFIDAEHALDPIYARKLGVKVDDLLISQPDAGEINRSSTLTP